MKIQPWHLAAIVGIGALIMFGGGTVFLTRAPRGKRLSSCTTNPNGTVSPPPEALRLQAETAMGRSVSMTAYAVARMLRSEGGSDTNIKRRVRAWVLWNDFQKLRKANGPARWPTLESVLVFSISKGENGVFGDQRGRRYATPLDPYEGDLIDAEAFIREFAAGKGDPTAGATKFVDKNALGKQPGTEGKTLASLEKDWGGKFRHVEGDLYVMA